MTKKMRYDEQEEQWFAQETPFSSEIATYWGGDFGVSSEVGALKAVLMRRPGPEIEGMDDASKWRFRALMDPEKARAQHDALTQVYRDNGVKVHYVEEMRRDRPNAMYMRDNVFMTPEGAILARQAIAARRGEELYVAKALSKIGVPIVRTITGTGVFEGACAMWIDPETIVLGTGNRCNREGAEQVMETLSRMGVKYFIPFHIPFGHAHVDGIMNMIDHDLALIFPWQTSHHVWAALRERGIEVLQAPSVEEVKGSSAVNFVALGPRKIVAPRGNNQLFDLLDKHGVEIIQVDTSEIHKGWGSIHCMTAFLKRED